MGKRVLLSSLIFLPFIIQLGYSTPSDPSDYWGHLITGRELVENGIVHVDTLNILPVKVDFHDYLGKIILYLTYKYRSLFKTLILYVILVELLILTDVNISAVALPYFLISIYFYSPFLRPMTLAFPLYLLVLLLLLRGSLIYTVPVIVLWSQIHASWVFGPLIILLYVQTSRCPDVSQYRRPDIQMSRCPTVWTSGFLYVWVSVLLALIIHPYHLGMFNVFKAVGKLSFIKEWNTPDPFSLIGLLFWAQTFLVFTLLYFREAKPPSSHFMLFLIFTVFSVLAVRNSPFQAAITAIIFSFYFPQKIPSLKNALAGCIIFTLIFPLFLKENPSGYKSIEELLPFFNFRDRFISLPGISDYIEFKTGAKALIDTRLLNPEAKKIFEKFIRNGDGKILEKLKINKVLLSKSLNLDLKVISTDTEIVNSDYILLKVKRR